jgi:hypothetical protein
LLDQNVQDLASVDLVLLYPVVEGRLGDAEIARRFSDALAGFDEGSRSSAKLGGIGSEYGLRLSSRPELNQ